MNYGKSNNIFFESQLYLAKKYNLSVNLHSRKSHEQLFRFLKQANLPKCGVVHGFSGSYDQAKRFVDLGYKIGVGGTITYERANKTRQAIAKLPLEGVGVRNGYTRYASVWFSRTT